jgi:hypothetical protein
VRLVLRVFLCLEEQYRVSLADLRLADDFGTAPPLHQEAKGRREEGLCGMRLRLSARAQRTGEATADLSHPSKTTQR